MNTRPRNCTGRALDDPVKLERAAAIVRAALARKIVDGMPPLTDEQRDKLALLRPFGDEAAWIAELDAKRPDPS